MYIGEALLRDEDNRFTTGHGEYVDDISPSDAAYMAVVRSPHPHARIRSVTIDESARNTGCADSFDRSRLASRRLWWVAVFSRGSIRRRAADERGDPAGTGRR